MKQEIEKILDEHSPIDVSNSEIDKPGITKELQKLFLSKQIEFINEIRNDPNPTYAYDQMIKRLKQLQYELESLE